MNPARALDSFSSLEVLTYSLDLGAAYWIASKRKNDRSVARIICDPAAFRPWFPKSGRGGNGVIRVRPAAGTALFHPKVWRITNDGKISLVISTANISIQESRLARNFFVSVHPHKAVRSQTNNLWQSLCAGKSSFLDVDLLTGRIQATSKPLRNVLWPLIRGLAGNGGRCVIASSAGISKKLLCDLLQQGRISELRAFVGGEAQLAVPKMTGESHSRVTFLAPGLRGEANLHGKLLYYEEASAAILYIGSANFTWAAYTGANVESGIVLRGDRRLLSGVVGNLLGGRWRTIEPNAKASEPEDEIDDHGGLQRRLAHCVTRIPRLNRIVVHPDRFSGKGKILRVELMRRSTGDRLEIADRRHGWHMGMHADILDQELVFRLSSGQAESIWMAAFGFDDTLADLGKESLSLSDIFQPVTDRRSNKRKGSSGVSRSKGSAAIGGEPLDVRFPWEVLPRLRAWPGDREAEAERYARRLVQDGDGSPASALRAAIVRQVILAADGRSR